jgi:hypothetical protein
VELEPSRESSIRRRWRSSVSPRWYAECCGDALHYDGFGVAAQGGPVWLAEPPAHQCVQRGASLGVVPGGALWSPRLWLPGHYPGQGVRVSRRDRAGRLG